MKTSPGTFLAEARCPVTSRAMASGGFFAPTMALSGGTFAIDIEDIVDHQDQVIVLCTVAAERNGQSWSSPEVHVWRVAGDRAVAFREFQGDQQTEDEFWSA